MKKSAVIFFVLLALGIGYWLISPLFVSNMVSERLPSAEDGEDKKEGKSSQEESVQIIYSGSFQGKDRHNASGTVKLIGIEGKKFIRFEDDFKITNGPDLFVYFGKNGSYDTNAQLGKLKGNEGSQNYEIPGNINPDDFNEIWVWCRAFSVPFGFAKLQ